MEKILYEGINVRLPDEFRTMTEEEVRTYYNNITFDCVFIEPEKKAVLGIVKNNNELEKEQVGKRIAEYQSSYARMAPGFVMGELLEKKGKAHNAAILTFKSNAPARDLYNIVSIMNMEGRELFLTFSCDLQDAPFLMRMTLRVIEDILSQIEESN
ncbi:hypothetical protein [Roseburia sp. 499]|uniref:hypothetical protein n=1 Tax=Roseburia sp. 499 TaxID=1261634 RepID=UPI000952097C|nr:hypothetical protein [Roseburia sp. 499]WVK68690.1 hypothetical protein BIV20_09845 [Roseburia sp. 499]